MKLLKSKKGIGMELAIFVLMVVFAFCSLISTMAYSLIMSKRSEDERLKTRITLDRIGESFIDYAECKNFDDSFGNTFELHNDDGSLYLTRDNLVIKFSDGNKTMTVEKSGKEIFTVKLNGDNKIICWQYL